jgi:hypothetical protein
MHSPRICGYVGQLIVPTDNDLLAVVKTVHGRPENYVRLKMWSKKT